MTINASEAGVTVTGLNFLPRERIVLKATIGTQSLNKTIRAGSTGRFTTKLDGDDATCSKVYVTATGARGTTAASRRVRIPDACGMVLQP